MEKLHIIPQAIKINKEQRQRLKKHKSLVIWFTGLSGSGKSTLANKLDQVLAEKGYHTYILDGDNMRLGLNKDLTFTEEDRKENIRRVAEVAKLFVDAGIIVLTAFISPFQSDRDMARNLLDKGEFIEIFVDCPLEVCEQRDVKGLYKKARKGEITNFTGIDSPYEAPKKAELVVHSDQYNIDDSVQQVISFILPKIEVA
jgi:adenylylsulfate kinase